MAQHNLAKGDLFHNMILFSLPYLLSYFLQTLYGLADLLIAGRFNGADVISAVSIGSQVMHMVTVMIVGLAMGTTIMIGRFVGAEDEDGIRRAIGNTITLFAMIAVLAGFGLAIFGAAQQVWGSGSVDRDPMVLIIIGLVVGIGGVAIAAGLIRYGRRYYREYKERTGRVN